MKVTSKQYAESLYQAVQNKKDSKVKIAVENFVKVLINNNDISKADEIIKQFVRIWNMEQGIVEAEVVSAKKLDKKIVKLLHSYIVKLSGAEKVLVKQRVDKDILGGVVIKYKDKVLDGSLRMRVGELRSKMVILNLKLVIWSLNAKFLISNF